VQSALDKLRCLAPQLVLPCALATKPLHTLRILRRRRGGSGADLDMTREREPARAYLHFEQNALE
jgi:hypothetical protein